MPDKPDILGRPDIERLVNAFYIKVRADEPLGHVFDGVAKVNWETHLPKLYDFWDTVLFRAGTFRGNPIAAHMKLDRSGRPELADVRALARTFPCDCG